MTVRRASLVRDADLSALLEAFVRGTTLEADVLSFVDLGISELFEILPDAYVVTPALGRAETIAMLRRALLDIRRSGDVSPAALLERANVLDRERRSVPNERFAMWTKFRARNMAHARGLSLEWHGVRMRTAARLPAYLARQEYFMNGVGRIHPDQPHFYGHMIVTCEDRNDSAAMSRMLDGLQLVMGLANIYLRWESWSMTTHRRWTDGPLWLGPHQFAFRRRRFLGDERIWYNPDYEEEAWTTHPPEMASVLNVVPAVRSALSALSDHPLRGILTRSIILMQDGFATRDGSHRLLRYWSALEQLYSEEAGRERVNQKVIDRASFAERDRALVRWKLAHASRLRNEHVHAGQGGGGDLLVLTQFLRQLLSRHLNHWIIQGADFANHRAMLAYVDLPTDEAALTSLGAAINRRMALLQEGRRTRET